jgi:TRAP-type mannitol/chloroaromatic compound transport system substrate-binding protein
VHDDETGETKTVEAPKRVKAWWWNGDNGKVCLSLRYGAKVMELAKGKAAIEISSTGELVPTLTILRDAVLSGELDAQIEAVSGAVKAGFKK